jgi:sulfoxide reductase catalytic subunit YedY
MIVILSSCYTIRDEKIILEPDTPDSDIVFMHPANVDPSRLPVDSIEDLHTTGSPVRVNLEKWRLEVKGRKVGNPLKLTYDELLQMQSTKKKVLLICPMFFADYAEWQGVPLEEVLARADVASNYQKITFTSLDGYEESFSRKDIEGRLMFLALKVNGQTLPEKHGFPVRLVAEDIFGGKWVKWLSTIEVR